MLRIHSETLQTCRPHPQSSAGWSAHWRPVAALGAAWSTFREGLVAHREYERLRSRGMPHDKALPAALSFGEEPSRRTRRSAKPLFAAGRA
jgi:hypothetical protein